MYSVVVRLYGWWETLTRYVGVEIELPNIMWLYYDLLNLFLAVVSGIVKVKDGTSLVLWLLFLSLFLFLLRGLL